MARPRKILDEKKQSQQVLALASTEPAGWRRERLLAVKLGLEGELGLEKIAQAVGRARATIQTWFDAYRAGGVEGLLENHRGENTGPQSWLQGEAKAELLAGLARGRWRTASQLQCLLAKEHRLEVALSTVYKYLGKAGARLRVPRPSHAKKNPAQSAAFKSELAQRLEALCLEPGRPVRLWVVDEMRCGRHPETRRVWALRGQRVVVPVQQKYEWSYVYGALEVGRAGAEFCYLNTVSLECGGLFLGQIAARDPGSIHVVIYDGAGFHHRDRAPALPDNVRIVSLPPYSPELNPVEKLWDIVRDGICNRVFRSLEELQEAIAAVLSLYWRDARRVFSLIGNGWLLAQANASGESVIPT